jgi:hypothetical protein
MDPTASEPIFSANQPPRMLKMGAYLSGMLSGILGISDSDAKIPMRRFRCEDSDAKIPMRTTPTT